MIPVEARVMCNKANKNRKVIYVMIFCIILFAGYAAMMGEAKISIKDVVNIIWGKLTFQTDIIDTYKKGIVAIVWDIRLPRIVTGIFVGAGLSVSGAVFQALLMNPLADPYTIGISTGAALGASIAILVTAILQIAFVAILPAAFTGALLTLYMVMQIAGKSSSFSSSSLIVAGIIVSSIGSAAISFIKTLAGDEVSIIVFWLMGSLASRTWSHVLIIAPVVFMGILVCRRYGRELNIISIGDIQATTYGVNVKKNRKILLIVASLITASCVSVSGIIGFVGLVIPHIVRKGISADYKFLIPISACLGALMMLAADTITRVLFPSEIPVGVLTTLIGGPFFIWLYTKRNNRIGELDV